MTAKKSRSQEQVKNDVPRAQSEEDAPEGAIAGSQTNSADVKSSGESTEDAASAQEAPPSPASIERAAQMQQKSRLSTFATAKLRRENLERKLKKARAQEREIERKVEKRMGRVMSAASSAYLKGLPAESDLNLQELFDIGQTAAKNGWGSKQLKEVVSRKPAATT